MNVNKRFGDCYKKAWMQITSMSNKDAENVRLVHGEVAGTGIHFGIRFGHAWIEKEIEIRKGVTVVMVNDCSNDRNIVLPRDLYYRLGKILDEHGKLFRYTIDEAYLNGAIFKGYGSWNMS